MPNRSFTQAQLFAGLVFAIIVGLTLFPPQIKLGKQPPAVWNALLRGNDPFIAPGIEFSLFEPLLPKNEKVSFILDFPFNPYVPNIDKLYSAQSYLVPRIISHQTKERAAIVFCSNNEIAQKRLEESGYRMLAPLGDGKGVAVQVQG